MKDPYTDLPPGLQRTVDRLSIADRVSDQFTATARHLVVEFDEAQLPACEALAITVAAEPAKGALAASRQIISLQNVSGHWGIIDQNNETGTNG